MTYASFWHRLGAHILDGAVVLPIIMLISILGPGNQSLAIVIVPAQGFAFYIYTLYYHGKFGQTIGKRLLKIKVLTTDGLPIDFSRSARRNIITFIQSLPWIFGTMIAISRVPSAQCYSLHGRAYSQLEESLRPDWYTAVTIAMVALLIAEITAVLTTKKNQSLHDFVLVALS